MDGTGSFEVSAGKMQIGYVTDFDDESSLTWDLSGGVLQITPACTDCGEERCCDDFRGDITVSGGTLEILADANLYTSDDVTVNGNGKFQVNTGGSFNSPTGFAVSGNGIFELNSGATSAVFGEMSLGGSGLYDFDEDFCTRSKLTFSGGTIDVATGKEVEFGMSSCE